MASLCSAGEHRWYLRQHGREAMQNLMPSEVRQLAWLAMLASSLSILGVGLAAELAAALVHLSH
jgi:hypothetical protein